MPMAVAGGLTEIWCLRGFPPLSPRCSARSAAKPRATSDPPNSSLPARFIFPLILSHLHIASGISRSGLVRGKQRAEPVDSERSVAATVATGDFFRTQEVGGA
ncbi:hypothetical protein GUJ93_ZPchr0007g3256 [Zizania palustris]|uniref:Uncharacterized protein n=1 Tax=Zizania palustris TaxID=103762 RepID=A0A8J5W4E1_ZIZPA|nr:hypothetical protein GUJ93_ZPchr0007g3256 [Zizania palustris]